MSVRACRESDASRICEIYDHFVRNTVVTFEEEPVSESDILDRIRTVKTKLPWLVWEEQGSVAGYAYASTWHPRSAYRYTVESTIYLAPGLCGRGVGTRLYSALLEELKVRRMHCVVGGIALPNPASVALHEKLGFSKVAHFSEVGRKFDRWIDVGYWELIL
jgi:phosphinothricin acetyltransferase